VIIVITRIRWQAIMTKVLSSEQEVSANDQASGEDTELEENELDVQLDQTIHLHRPPSVAHTSQLVLNEINKNQGFYNLIVKAMGIVRSVRVSSIGTQSLMQEFWIERAASYSNLTSVAPDLMITAPASETYIERVFSLCGDLCSGKRNRMNKNLEQDIFLKLTSIC
jgi:hAT family C-terminal dimerisation region